MLDSAALNSSFLWSFFRVFRVFRGRSVFAYACVSYVAGSGVLEIAAEYENVRSAWNWAIAHLQSMEQTEAIAGAVRILGNFYQCQSRYLEASELLVDAIRLLEHNAQVEVNASALAECLICASWLAIRLGRPTEAEQSLTRARQIYDLLPPQYHYSFLQLQQALIESARDGLFRTVQASQFSTFKPRTRLNSSTLAVTTVAPVA